MASFSELVLWPGLCFLANMLFCPGMIMHEAFVSELGFVLFSCLPYHLCDLHMLLLRSVATSSV